MPGRQTSGTSWCAPQSFPARSEPASGGAAAPAACRVITSSCPLFFRVLCDDTETSRATNRAVPYDFRDSMGMQGTMLGSATASSVAVLHSQGLHQAKRGASLSSPLLFCPLLLSSVLSCSLSLSLCLRCTALKCSAESPTAAPASTPRRARRHAARPRCDAGSTRTRAGSSGALRGGSGTRSLGGWLCHRAQYAV